MIRRDWRTVGASAALAAALGIAAAGGMAAQETPTPAPDAAQSEAFPVDIHTGTCDAPTPEAAANAGIAEPIQGIEEAEGQELVEAATEDFDLGDDEIFNQEDEGFLSIDTNGDGALEIGRDEDENGTLEPDEVVGIDEDGDGALNETEIGLGGVGEEDDSEAQAAAVLDETVYKADTELEDVNTDDLFAQPHVLLVHQSEQAYGNYLACGEIRPLLEEDQIVVLLRPTEQSDFFGTALIQEDGSEAATFLFRGLAPQGTGQAPTPAPIPTATPEPSPTAAPPPPSPTAEATAVITTTEVVTVTEVVEAPTATAEAEG